MSIDTVAAHVSHKSPQFFRGIMTAPVTKRPFMLALIGLDIELWAAANSSGEDMVNAIKLAWWADAVERLPEGKELHDVLGALVEAGVDKAIALQMVAAFQDERESLQILMRALADHLGADGDEMVELIHSIATKRHQPRKWPREARPLVTMLVPSMVMGGRFTALRLVMTGRG